MRILTLVLALCLVLGVVGTSLASDECLRCPEFDTAWVDGAEVAVVECFVPFEPVIRAWYSLAYQGLAELEAYPYPGLTMLQRFDIIHGIEQ